MLENKAEQFNIISALTGAIVSIFGVVWLIALAIHQGDPWKISSFSIYGLTLILVYVFATLYHGTNGRAKAVYSKLDHLSIYLLIAGTYTPFTLVTLRNSVGWQLFGIIWGLALVGIILDMMPKAGNRLLPVFVYLLMGWLMVVALNPLLRALPMPGFYYLLTGGLFYTVGIVFYLLDEKVIYFHGIWHLFVISGSLSQYLSILFYVA
ncbi:MAG: hemolysin III family protein [Methylobacter sp.]|nr:hemolysin III family protein [Methylobacter sp.]